MPRPTAVPNHHPTRRWTYPCSETLQRSPITRTSPLLSLPNEILLIILHLVIASETPTTQLTTPHPNLKCTCVPLLPNPSVRSSTKKPWPSRLRTSLKKPWYSHCLRLCNRLESWAADPGLPHLYPPSRMPNLSVARTCQALYPLAVEALYALNTLTLTSSEVEVMLLSPAGKGVMEKLTGLRVLERKIEESIWVQELIYRPPRTSPQPPNPFSAPTPTNGHPPTSAQTTVPGIPKRHSAASPATCYSPRWHPFSTRCISSTSTTAA
ncbi:uncharacterized protein MYCGRDRAFT_93707 [Zymoseptoria tritici IPO323]|uniref:Uncharacterized protein n=1 Tax=Zymoseptoria tritici (strain CBS 115943 / IPO323) TaxID=336722 RepID=F9XCR3_ZYMTI|nr:uncharacterized protein MYCGRDRAFT_93707 [Zymoseptoria tritici IPO323]EGP86919.1 hypothetical protein MYCGRDRAFT_93707 [Zymoseptoria tritici IPO323]